MLSVSKAKYMIYVDTERCVGCRSCEIACAVEHSATKNLFTAIREKPLPNPRVLVLHHENVNVPLRCLHCADAPCTRVCPSGAMHYTPEGFVVCDEAKCIGCGLCSLACPIGHPEVSTATGKVIKCDFCYHRVREGREPACVEACPTGALIFGTTSEVLEEIRRRAAKKLVSGLSYMIIPGETRATVPGAGVTKPA